MDVASLIDEKLKPIFELLNSLNKKVTDLDRRVGLLEGSSETTNAPPLPPNASSKKYDIFISLHVASSLKYAQSLKSYLERHFNCSIFICTNMMGGISYREQIVDGIESCKLFIPLINIEWAESAECGDEFNYARRINLISHKSGKTKTPQPRFPVIIPVYYKDFDFMQYKVIRLLASSVNFLPLDVNQPEPTWIALIASVEYLHVLPETSLPASVSSTAPKLNSDLIHALELLQNDISDNLTGGGTFILTGKTVNNYDGNTTQTDRCLLTFAGGRVTGSIDYKAGTLYNTSDVAPIEGTYDIKTGVTNWTEIYHHGGSHFEYTGRINGNTIKGTYYWREKPTATGKFEFSLERWL